MWHPEMKKEAEFLRATGTVARYTVESGQPHRLETLAGASAGRFSTSSAWKRVSNLTQQHDDYWPDSGGTAAINSARAAFSVFMPARSPRKCPILTTTKSCEGITNIRWPPAPLAK